jgi:hypothetical protein
MQYCHIPIANGQLWQNMFLKIDFELMATIFFKNESSKRFKNKGFWRIFKVVNFAFLCIEAAVGLQKWILKLYSYNATLEHPHPLTPRVWHMVKLDEKYCKLFQIASGATTFLCQARGLVKLSLVSFILHSTYHWLINYLRGTFGV